VPFPHLSRELHLLPLALSTGRVLGLGPLSCLCAGRRSRRCPVHQQAGSPPKRRAVSRFGGRAPHICAPYLGVTDEGEACGGSRAGALQMAAQSTAASTDGRSVTGVMDLCGRCQQLGSLLEQKHPVVQK